jgi:hypothetical protein
MVELPLRLLHYLQDPVHYAISTKKFLAIFGS